MRYTLKRHPDSPCAAATHIEVDVARPLAGGLLLSYVVAGKIGDLVMPAVTALARADELWRHTCFEAFIHPKQATGVVVQMAQAGTPWFSPPPDDFPTARRGRHDGSGPVDPAVLSSMVGCLLLTALAACALPALRASRIEPMQALRTE